QALEGQLFKYTNVMKGWQYRWFVLDPDSGFLEYFEKEEHKKQRPRGAIHLAASVISPSDEDSQTFTVNAANGDVYRLRASDARERQQWIDRLRSTSEYHTATIAQHSVVPTGTPVLEGTPTTIRPHTSSNENLHHTPVVVSSDIKGFDIRIGSNNIRAALTVTRANEALLAGQISLKFNMIPRAARNHPTRSHRKTSNIDQSVSPDTLLEAKEYLIEVEDYSRSLDTRIEDLPKSGEYLTSLDKNLLLLKATSIATMQCLHQCLQILQAKQASTNHHHHIPPTAMITPPKQRTFSALRRTSSIHSTHSTVESYSSITSAPLHSPEPKQDNVIPAIEQINHEDEVEDETEYTDSELNGVEEHKSIILHLLSQLKLGMDLTKVVLPTFILERRSLLEMFADCMAHPDMFLKIPEKSDAESRMLAVLEWYLTSFHAGRQGSVAKKPYNPIIGETFHCSWEIPVEKTEEDADEVTDDSTAKSTERLIYSAEQVSHHPPVSAFYFECPSRKICMNASIWTKSKFMGMSIGVVMVGKVRLHLLEYDEEYIFSLPSAYARSILTVPWVEMGDKITVTCPQSNVTSSVVFHTKPFYGGKLHRVSAEVKNGNTGDIVCKVQGEWNANLDFNYANGETKTIDVQKLKVWKKRVRPQTLQNDNESRKLWQHVTKALSLGDVETATEHKHLLEDKQREGERHRKEANTEFPTKLFQKVEDTWVYKQPLTPILQNSS
ncbi:hypothetical protein LOTGIDRAFT_152778, partial [Lottia gigantea]